MDMHKKVWEAIDTLAQINDISVSRLARNAGLDPTTFNKSKRIGPNGRKRWPSAELLVKITAATGVSMTEFWGLIDPNKRRFVHRDGISEKGDPTEYATSRPIPLLGLAEAGSGGYFDDGGFPVGEGWDEIYLPHGDDEGVFAFEISGDSMLPTYRSGDRIVLSQSEIPRTGDRVVVKSKEGEVLAKVLARKTANLIELHSINQEHEDRRFKINEVEWIYRILWASQ